MNDALLADLQNTIAPPSPAPSGPSYNTLNGGGFRGDYATVNSNSKLERSNSLPKYKTARSPPLSPPIYQNETKKTPGNLSSTKMSTSLNNNLSELDNLLNDLSTSRYSERKVPIFETNGNEISPIRPSTARSTSAERPSVDSLLNELNTAVSTNGGTNMGSPYVMKKMMMEETTTTTTKTIRPAASSATKELDDLMASLSDLKVFGEKEEFFTTEESSYAKPVRKRSTSQNSGQLDSMLGSLQADMSRQGINTTQKGCCNACDKPIVGQVITALGRTWHPEHFTCNHCTQELGTRNFFERDGHPYCEPDYHKLFSPRCNYCNGPILDKCVTALEKTWHTEHFFCAQCGKQFGEDGFHERDGKPYCRSDYFNMFAPKCGACFRPIMENYVSALSQQWHSSCFVCRDCKKSITGKSFYALEGKPVCPTCIGVEDH